MNENWYGRWDFMNAMVYLSTFEELRIWDINCHECFADKLYFEVGEEDVYE